MQGLELAKIFYLECVLPMLERDFPNELPRIAIGLAGRGSECFGFDDAISRDHDFQIGVLLWITPEDDAEFGHRLMRSYCMLPMDFCKIQMRARSAGGFSEHGVCSIPDFYERHIGTPGAPKTWREWLDTPDHAFAEATNGAVFRDDSGVFSAVREEILHGMPEDVRLKKMAARAALMAQSGQYNYARCEKRGERGAAAIALAEFVRNAIPLVFLLNKSFAPYEKWMFRALRALPRLGLLADDLTRLLVEPDPSIRKADLVESVCAKIIEELKRQGVSDSHSDYLENHAFSMTSRIRNRDIRALHLMEG